MKTASVASRVPFLGSVGERLRGLVPVRRKGSFAGLWCAVMMSAATTVHAAVPPRIDRVDPPNWWTNLPPAMLLLHGEGLAVATVDVGRAQGRVLRTSDNGHWAFVELPSAQLKPGQLKIVVHSPAGVAQFDYRMQAADPSWTGPQGLSQSDVIYLVMPDRFANGDWANDLQPGLKLDRSDPHAWHGGDLKGVANHLGYIQATGADAIWLTPIVENAEQGSYHGYGATDLYRVDPHLGTLNDARALSDALHSRSMKFILDIVPNHVGPGHPWVSDEPTPDWFHGTAAAHLKPLGEFEGLIDPTAPQSARKHILEGWFDDALPDMNQGDPLVARYFIENTIWWVQATHADALRLDTFSYVDRPFWNKFHSELAAVFPRLSTVGEVFSDRMRMTPAINAFFAGGVTQTLRGPVVDTRLWTPFDYPFYQTVREVLLRGRPMTDLYDLFSQDALYPHPDRLVPLIGSHDTFRFASEPGATPARLRLALGLLYTVRGSPVLYAGDEIGMPGGSDPDNRRDFPGGFGGAFGEPDVGGKEARATLAYVRAIAAFRHDEADLMKGQQQIIFAEDDTLAYVRGSDLQQGCRKAPRLLVVANKSAQAKQVAVESSGTSLRGCTLSSKTFGAFSARLIDGGFAINVPPESVIAVRMQ